jgi:hypothetical protein
VELNREGELNTTIQLPPEPCRPTAIAVVAKQVWVMGNQQHRVRIFRLSNRLRGEWRWEEIRSPSAFTYNPRMALCS